MTALKGHDEFDCLSVSTFDELKVSLESDEMSLVVMDMDQREDKAKEILGELTENYSHCVVFLSREKASLEALKPLEKDYNIVHKILERPHEEKSLLAMITTYRSQLLSDNPVDMKKGGTASIDVTSIFVGDLRKEGALEKESASLEKTQVKDPAEASKETPGEQAGGNETAVVDSVESSLEGTDQDKESFVLSSDENDDAPEDSSSEPTLESSPPTAGEESSLDDVLGTSILDLPDEIQESKEGEKPETPEALEEPEAPEELEALEVLEASEVLETPEEEADELVLEGDRGDELVLGGEEASFDQSGDEDEGEVLSLEEGSPEPEVLGQEESVSLDVSELKKESEFISEHHEGELLRLKSSLEVLSEERDLLSNKLNEQEKNDSVARTKINSLQAELDEAKIENIFLKKRYEKEIENVKYSEKLAREKRDILLERNKKLEEDLNLVQAKTSFDSKKVQERERALESQLELMKVDSESLLKSRDDMIVKLRRKIDALEFDFQTLFTREKKMREEKYLLEERLDRVKDVLKSTVGNIDEELLAEKLEDGDKKLTGF